jgi:hypothetical protein
MSVSELEECHKVVVFLQGLDVVLPSMEHIANLTRTGQDLHQ